MIPAQMQEGEFFSCGGLPFGQIRQDEDHFLLRDLLADVVVILHTHEIGHGIAGVLMGLGVMFAPDGKARNSANLNEIRKRFFSEFDSIYPCTSCNTLRSQYAVPERKCESLLVGIADIAEKLIEEYRNEDNSNS